MFHETAFHDATTPRYKSSSRSSWNMASWRRGTPLACRPKPRRDAIDGQEQRREIALLRRLARGRAVAAQQLDLLAVHLVQGRQATPEPLAKPWEPLRGLAAPRHAAHDLDGAVVLLL